MSHAEQEISIVLKLLSFVCSQKVFFFSVTLRNVTEVLEFAMLYNASQLRDVCTELLTNNLATVIESRFVMFKVVCHFLFKNSA